MRHPHNVLANGAPTFGPPARIAYIMSRFPKITETFVFYEILAMDAMGLPVDVYPLLREHQKVAHPEAETWVARARFQPFISLPILRAHVHFLRRAPARYARVLWDVLRHTWGSRNFFIGAIGIFPKAVRFAYEMEERRTTHIHAHFATHPTVAAFIAHRLTGIPFSFTAHGSDLHVDRRMLDIKVAASAFAVTISAYNKEVMVRTCGEQARSKIRIVRCGVDPAVFSPSRRAATHGTFEIACVASFEEVKGHRYLITACRLLHERGVDFRCHLIGDGPLRREVVRWISEAALESHVVLHGSLARPDVARLLGSADAAVLASYPTKEGKREGIPVALMEAMACGLPVVSTAISGIPELVESGVTGYLVPPCNASALADALQTLAADRDLRERMGEAGREKVAREFNIHLNTRLLLDLFVGVRSEADAPALRGSVLTAGLE